MNRKVNELMKKGYQILSHPKVMVFNLCLRNIGFKINGYNSLIIIWFNSFVKIFISLFVNIINTSHKVIREDITSIKCQTLPVILM